MHNNTYNSSSGFSGRITSGPVESGVMQSQPEPTLNQRAGSLKDGLVDLNQQIAALRSLLFGEGESLAKSDRGAESPASLTSGIYGALSELSEAQIQMSSILSRL
jgi:hypothetical protein